MASRAGSSQARRGQATHFSHPTSSRSGSSDSKRFSASFPTIGAGPYDLDIKEVVTEADPVTQTFRVSLIYLSALFLAMLVDRVL